GRKARGRYAAAMSDASAGEFEEYNEYAGTMKPKGMLSGLLGRFGYSGTGFGGGGGGQTWGGAMGAVGVGMAGAAMMSQGMQAVVNRDNAISAYTITEGMRANLSNASHNQTYGGLGMQIKGN